MRGPGSVSYRPDAVAVPRSNRMAAQVMVPPALPAMGPYRPSCAAGNGQRQARPMIIPTFPRCGHGGPHGRGLARLRTRALRARAKCRSGGRGMRLMCQSMMVAGMATRVVPAAGRRHVRCAPRIRGSAIHGRCGRCGYRLERTGYAPRPVKSGGKAGSHRKAPCGAATSAPG